MELVNRTIADDGKTIQSDSTVAEAVTAKIRIAEVLPQQRAEGDLSWPGLLQSRNACGTSAAGL